MPTLNRHFDDVVRDQAAQLGAKETPMATPKDDAEVQQLRAQVAQLNKQVDDLSEQVAQYQEKERQYSR